MTAQTQQDSQFITEVRTQASGLLNVGDEAYDMSSAWTSCFGGALRLVTESFTGNNEGLDKTDVENALNVLIALNTWLDAAGENRRIYLQKVRIVS